MFVDRVVAVVSRVVVSNVVGGRPSNRNEFSRCCVWELDDVGIIVNKYNKMYECVVGSVRPVRPRSTRL